jgi:hypothetical protein
MPPVNNNPSPIATSWNIDTDNAAEGVKPPAQTPPELVLDSPLPVCQKSDLPPGRYGEGVDEIGMKMNLMSAEAKGGGVSGSTVSAKGTAAADSHAKSSSAKSSSSVPTGVGGAAAVGGVTAAGGQGVKIVSPVYNVAGRDFVVVDTTRGRQAFYRSSGINSGNEGKWYPVDEFRPSDFNKQSYVRGPGRGPGEPLHRVGNEEFAKISEDLGKMRLPAGAEVPEGLAGETEETTANRILDFFNARHTPYMTHRPVPDDLGAVQDEAAAESGQIAKQGGTEAAEGAASKGAGAAGEVVQGAKTASGAAEGVSAATRAGVETTAEGIARAGVEGGIKLGGASVAMEALGFAGFMLAPLDLLKNYLGAYEEAKGRIKAENYTNGFADGVAAALKGMSPADTGKEFWLTPDPSVEDKILGSEGLGENYHNKGLVDGYKFFKSLPPEKQQSLREAATKNGWDLKKDDAYEVAAKAIKPMVVDMFEKVRKAAEEEEARKMAQQLSGMAIMP